MGEKYSQGEPKTEPFNITNEETHMGSGCQTKVWVTDRMHSTEKILTVLIQPGIYQPDLPLHGHNYGIPVNLYRRKIIHTGPLYCLNPYAHAQPQHQCRGGSEQFQKISPPYLSRVQPARLLQKLPLGKPQSPQRRH